MEIEDPLGSFVVTDPTEDDYAEEDMTVEESMHFNFDEEDTNDNQEEYEERDLKPDISKLHVESYGEDSNDAAEEDREEDGRSNGLVEESSIEITSLQAEDSIGLEESIDN